MCASQVLTDIVRHIDTELPVNVKCLLKWKELAHSYGDLPVRITPFVERHF